MSLSNRRRGVEFRSGCRHLNWRLLGVIAFVPNYIPFIGPFDPTVFPTLFVPVRTGSVACLLCRICMSRIIQFVIGSHPN